MAVTIDITDQDVFTAIVTLLGNILPTGTQVIQGQQNNVAMPDAAGGFVLMTSAGMQRLGTNVDTLNSTTQVASIVQPTQYMVQLDFYGPTAQSWALQVQTLMRDEFAADLLPANIQPLYAEDPVQIPLMNAESQYEQRWKMQAAFYYGPTLTTAQQSATALSIKLKPIDQTFKP